MKEIAVLTNPASGHGKAREVGERAVARFRELGIVVRELSGDSAEESIAMAREAAASGVDAVVAAGGDGLISCVIQALATTSVPLGIVPGGTGNDLAREFGIPVDDPLAAVDVVVNGVTRVIDLGRVDDRWFATVLSSGFDSRVTDRANTMSWPKGRMRYNVAMVGELATLKAVPYRIELDDQVVEVDAIMVTIGNTRSYGGGMLVVPTAVPDDGLLDVTVLRATSIFRLLRLFPTIYKGTHVDLDGVDVYRSKRVRIEAPDTSSYADGEPFGNLPLTAVADSGVLHLRCPAPAAGL